MVIDNQSLDDASSFPLDLTGLGASGQPLAIRPVFCRVHDQHAELNKYQRSLSLDIHVGLSVVGIEIDSDDCDVRPV